MIRAFLSTYRGKYFDYTFGNGFAGEMPLVTFKITPLCNLRCMMCGQNGIKGTLKDKTDIESLKIVPIDRYKELTDEIAHKTRVFYIWGENLFFILSSWNLPVTCLKELFSQ